MVREQDFVELDPEPEDILAVWGYEVLEKNLEKYIPAIKGARTKPRGLGRSGEQGIE